jgi:hypothetical protein
MLDIFKKKEVISGLRTYDFYREENVTQLQGIPLLGKFGPKKDRWYIDLPEWTGPKANLELVAGAEDMFELLSKGKERISVSFCDKLEDMFTTPNAVAPHVVLRHLGGGDYSVNVTTDVYNSDEFPKEIWLCSVTEFIFGAYPEYMYIRSNEDVKPRFNLKKS